MKTTTDKNESELDRLKREALEWINKDRNKTAPPFITIAVNAFQPVQPIKEPLYKSEKIKKFEELISSPLTDEERLYIQDSFKLLPEQPREQETYGDVYDKIPTEKYLGEVPIEPKPDTSQVDEKSTYTHICDNCEKVFYDKEPYCSPNIKILCWSCLQALKESQPKTSQVKPMTAKEMCKPFLIDGKELMKAWDIESLKFISYGKVLELMEEYAAIVERRSCEKCAMSWTKQVERREDETINILIDFADWYYKKTNGYSIRDVDIDEYLKSK